MRLAEQQNLSIDSLRFPTDGFPREVRSGWILLREKTNPEGRGQIRWSKTYVTKFPLYWGYIWPWNSAKSGAWVKCCLKLFQALIHPQASLRLDVKWSQKTFLLSQISWFHRRSGLLYTLLSAESRCIFPGHGDNLCDQLKVNSG